MMTFDDMEATLKGGPVRAVSAPQLFPTPPALAARMCEGVEDNDSVLEPSAGTGAILRALPEEVFPPLFVIAVEFNHDLANGLRDGWAEVDTNQRHVYRADFLECQVQDGPDGCHYGLGLFDWVLANPPFAKGQDMRHIRHMWEFLKPGGRLVTLSGTGWTFGERKVCREFREWLDEIGATIEEIPAGTFAGTGIATRLIRATK